MSNSVWISSYGAPLAQIVSYQALYSSLYGPDGAISYVYIVTNSITHVNWLKMYSQWCTHLPLLRQFGLCFKMYQKLCYTNYQHMFKNELCQNLSTQKLHFLQVEHNKHVHMYVTPQNLLNSTFINPTPSLLTNLLNQALYITCTCTCKMNTPVILARIQF